MKPQLFKIPVLIVIAVLYSNWCTAQGGIWDLSGPHISPTVTGNIGIDTSNPDKKLTVAGKIHADDVIVDLNVPAPDYVFEKTYPLKPVEEVEDFVKQNKHLPEIPSAREMRVNGINLSEMSMLILKKTEELTLYVIDHEKRIAILENNIKQNKKP